MNANFHQLSISFDPTVFSLAKSIQEFHFGKVLSDNVYITSECFRNDATAEMFSLSSLVSVIKTLGAIRRGHNTNSQNKISMMTSDFQMRPTSNTSGKSSLFCSSTSEHFIFHDGTFAPSLDFYVALVLKPQLGAMDNIDNSVLEGYGNKILIRLI